MFGKRVGRMRRGGPPKRSASLRRKAPLKRGAPSPFRERVKYLHRAAVMLRAGAHVAAKTFRTVSWEGRCERCGRCGRLVVSHLFAQGKHPNSAFLSANAMAKCAPCHDWWHANGIEAADWLREVKGLAWVEELRARVLSRHRQDLPLDAALLVTEIRARGIHENDVIPEGCWASA